MDEVHGFLDVQLGQVRLSGRAVDREVGVIPVNVVIGIEEKWGEKIERVGAVCMPFEHD